ncbi:tripartite tricarboxylate transporter substrate binding protein [soil metagenome]
MDRRSLLRAAGAIGAMAASPWTARADAPWPNRPIRFVVPFAAGGGSDIVARLLSDELGRALNTTLLVDNRPGMAASLGADIVAKSPPDGYTILFCTPGVQITNPFLYSKLPYDPERDFTAISLLGRLPNLLVVHPDLPVKSVSDLISYAKANPEKLSYSSTGKGSTSHLACELFKSMAGIQMVHVPYKGSGPAMLDLLSGRVQVTIDSYTVLVSNVQKAGLRAVGISTERRFAEMPDLPAIAETLPGFEGSSLLYIAAPANTPRDIVMKLNNAFNVTISKPEIESRLRELGLSASPGAPELLASVVQEERVKWKHVIEISGAKATD